jgi:hypothetical protein
MERGRNERLHGCTRIMGQWTLATWLVFSFGPQLTMQSALVMAQTPTIASGPLAGFLRGEMEEVLRDTVIIDNKRYELREDVVLKDDRDQPRELKDFKAGSLVAYHLKMGRIDQLVLILPK